MNLWIIFLTGLTTGGLTCLAMQGGLLTSVIAAQKEKELREPSEETKPASFDALDWQPVALFLASKLVSHTILGFMLGAFGSVMTLSLTTQLSFQVFSALFMFATAMNLLNVHPIFRFVVLQPPRFLQRFIRRYSKSADSLFAPALLGVLTIFVPCGITQAMEVLAINSANPFQGALIMAAFVLGTIPMFSIIGIATAKLSEAWKGVFLKVAAFALIAVALVSLNGVLEVIDAPINGTRIKQAWTMLWSPQTLKSGQSTAIEKDGKQFVTIDIKNSGYSPTYIRVKKGVPVQLLLRSNKAYSCALQFTLRAFGIRESLDATDERTVTFTPTQTGRFTYTCSMGMYSGILEVI